MLQGVECGDFPVRRVTITADNLAHTHAVLDGGGSSNDSRDGERRCSSTCHGTGKGDAIELVALGNPHLSLEECATLAELMQGRQCRRNVAVVVTLGRAVLEAAQRLGYADILRSFGAELITDVCWCMLTEPIVPLGCKTILTNSAKYAHYAPGLVGRRVRFGNLAACVSAAVSGLAPPQLPPPWLAVQPKFGKAEEQARV